VTWYQPVGILSDYNEMPFGFSIPEKRLLKVGQRFLEWGDRYAVRLPAVRSLV
jgi:hypothetical protein